MPAGIAFSHVLVPLVLKRSQWLAGFKSLPNYVIDYIVMKPITLNFKGLLPDRGSDNFYNLSINKGKIKYW